MDNKMLTEYSIDYDATTIEGAIDYMNYRSKQLLKFGYKYISNEITYIDNENEPCGISYCFIDGNNNKFISFYILKQFRGKGFFMKVYKKYNPLKLKIITLKECNIDYFLKNKNIEYVMCEHDNAYYIIQSYYGDKRAKRTNVPHIYHIDEGLGYMLEINASDVAKQAYSLHPLLQSDDEFNKNIKYDFNSMNISTEVLLLTMEYRRVANSYLSINKKEDFVGFTNNDIYAMLYGDKKQNYKDFMKYHFNKHKRSKELYEYFNNWFDIFDNYNNK